MTDSWIILATTLGGIGFGFGTASIVYIRIFTKQLKQLHDDNVETAGLLVAGDAETARLLVSGDKTREKGISTTARILLISDDNRRAEVTQTAADLVTADEVVTRKVQTNGVDLNDA